MANVNLDIELRPVLKEFVMEMERKLRINDHKTGWHDCAIEWLLNRAYEELDEVRDAYKNRGDIYSGDHQKIIMECADVANFMMMIADNVQRNQNIAQNALGSSDRNLYGEHP